MFSFKRFHLVTHCKPRSERINLRSLMFNTRSSPMLWFNALALKLHLPGESEEQMRAAWMPQHQLFLRCCVMGWDLWQWTEWGRPRRDLEVDRRRCWPGYLPSPPFSSHPWSEHPWLLSRGQFSISGAYSKTLMDEKSYSFRYSFRMLSYTHL